MKYITIFVKISFLQFYQNSLVLRYEIKQLADAYHSYENIEQFKSWNGGSQKYRNLELKVLSFIIYFRKLLKIYKYLRSWS